MKKEKDIVKVTCYYKTEEYERTEAINKFRECVLCSEGSEQSRYSKILGELLSGYKECSDEEFSGYKIIRY